jgi:hydrogenase 3 maturation protease
MWNKSLNKAPNTVWIEPLRKSLIRSREYKANIAIMGVGHELRGDDSAGIFVARELKRRGIGGEDGDGCVHVIEADHAPENFTGLLRRLQPSLVLIVDSANICELPGTVRLLSWYEVGGMDTSTHTMPLSMLANYLDAELKCEVALLGIQPSSTTLGAKLSPEVRHAVRMIVSVLVSELRR